MDKCKLCGEHPSSYVFDGVTRYHCAKKFKENSCPNSRTDFTPEQWAALMGQPEPDMFWVSDRPEDSFHSIDDIADDVVDNGLWRSEGELIIEIDMAASLPKRKIICWCELDDDSEIRARWKWADQESEG